VGFEGHRHVKFGAVINGHCWLTVDGARAPVELAPGDCYLVIGDRRYQLASDLDVKAVPAAPLFARLADGVAQCGAGQDSMLIGGNFTFDEANATLLLEGLPAVIHVPASSDHAGQMRATLHLIASEAATEGLGGALMLDRLAHVLFLQALRAYARERAPAGKEAPGLLPALLDPQVGPALRLMHEDLARDWTVASLATAVTMSRSSFALRFRATVGVAPWEYLTRLRMHAAGQLLRDSDQTVSAVATAVGYASETSFSTAFRRVMSTSPHAFRRP
jgi:AraC-like DNA-binding protein